MTNPYLASVHFIARSNDQDGKLKSIAAPGEFESGRWTFTAAAADQAVGAELHLHERQNEPSWFAGRILSWRPSDLEGRVFFRFQLDRSLCRKQRTGWGNEQARVMMGASKE